MQNDLVLAKNGDMDINEFIMKYKPFIYAVINQYEGSYVTDEDELSTIGMLAFKEAYDTYVLEKGNFYSYAKMVIKSRLIDYFRKEKKYRDNEFIYLNNDSFEKLGLDTIESEEALEKFNMTEENFFRKDEILRLSRELKSYGITFRDLEKITPKKYDLAVKYKKSAEFVVKNRELLKKFIENGRLPATEIENEIMITKKQIDRGRKYIIALILIKKGDYELISEYIK
jgi:RNA polymerase sigma factor